MNIIFLTHWFPPFNEIGAVRPYELARFLAGAGHHVSVVTSSGNWSPQTYKADISGFDVVRVEIPSLMRYADSPKPNFGKRLIKRFFLSRSLDFDEEEFALHGKRSFRRKS
jgi:hypothetical protein